MEKSRDHESAQLFHISMDRFAVYVIGSLFLSMDNRTPNHFCLAVFDVDI
jgi:hypothetical protein